MSISNATRLQRSVLRIASRVLECLPELLKSLAVLLLQALNHAI